MTDLRTAAQQALEALEGWENHDRWVWPESALEQAKRNTTEALAALKAALAEPVQEPVAWIHTDPEKGRVKFLEWRENEPGYRGDWIKTPLYTSPPQRKPLTEEEIDSIWDSEKAFADIYAIARAIERAHGIGGQP